MKRWIALPAALLLLVLVIAGCGSSDDTTGAETTAEATESSEAGGSSETGGDGSASGSKVSYISPVAAQPGQQQIFEGFQQGAQELGWSANVLDSAISPDKQVSNIETAVNQGDVAITSWTLDPNAAGGAYEKAQAKGIPVIGVNSEGTGVTATVWWEQNRCDPGGPQAISADRMAEWRPNAKVIMIGLQVAESTRAYSECFAKEAKRAGLDVINETNNEADNAAGSQKVFEPLLTKYPEVEAVWCYNDESALGVSAALLAAGKSIATSDNPDEGIIVSGENGDKGAVEAVEQGRISWSWDPDSPATGLASVKLMKEAVETGKAKDVIVEANLVDSESVGEYVAPEEREYTLEDLPLKK